MKASIYYVILLLIVGQSLLFKNGLIRTLKFDSLLLYLVVNDHIVQWRAIQTALLPVYDEKWGHFERAKMTLKMLSAS